MDIPLPNQSFENRQPARANMADKKVLEQYKQMGEDYITNQRAFFADKQDWSREKLRTHLATAKGGRVLDIGCGAGDDIKWCEETGIEAYGIDPSEKMYELAKKFVSNPDRIKIGDFESVPFPNGYFDMTIGRFSLHYLKDFNGAYTEVARSLKKGGKILLVVSHPTYDSEHRSRTGEERMSVTLYDDRVTVQFPSHSLTDYFSETFLSLFDLCEIGETDSVDAENPTHVPETLFYAATKR